MAIYLKFRNTKGIDPHESHANQIAVLLKTFALGISREITLKDDQPHAGEWSGTATITKTTDRTVTTQLKQALAAGQALFVTMPLTRSSRTQEILSYKLSNCVLNDYDVSMHDTDNPIETLELSFSVTEGFMHYACGKNKQSARRAL